MYKESKMTVKTIDDWRKLNKKHLTFLDKVKTIEYDEYSKLRNKNYTRKTDLLLVSCECGRQFEITGKIYSTIRCQRCLFCSRQKHDYVGKIVSGHLCIDQFHRIVSGREFIFLNVVCSSCKEPKDIKADVFLSGEFSCCACEDNRKLSIFPKKGITLPRYFSRIKKGAETRGLIFQISIDDLMECLSSQDNRCALSGIQIGFADGSASLDRKNSTIGYTVENIQWVYRPFNFMKNQMTNQQFIELCQSVAVHSGLVLPIIS